MCLRVRVKKSWILPRNFTAIDFETASRRHDSACQLGLATVRQGQIVDRVCWLIRPRPLYFHRANIQIHGITPEQVGDEPEFGELWPAISAKIGDDCLVAHNAAFDLRVLIGTLRSHRHPIPELQFTCTRAIARRTWPHLRRDGLKPLSNWLGIRFRHHDALEDAVACAKILLAAGIDREATSLPDLERRLRLRTGKAGSWHAHSKRIVPAAISIGEYSVAFNSEPVAFDSDHGAAVSAARSTDPSNGVELSRLRESRMGRLPRRWQVAKSICSD